MSAFYYHPTRAALVCAAHVHRFKKRLQPVGAELNWGELEGDAYSPCPHCTRSADAKVARQVVKGLEGWAVFATYAASAGIAVHTVERNGDRYRCTCRGFRIRKVGECKHTRLSEEKARRGLAAGGTYNSDGMPMSLVTRYTGAR